MRNPDELRALVEDYLADLALTPELHGQADAVRYALVGRRQLLELRASLLQPRKQLLRPRERFFRTHVTRSLTMRPRMPFTRRAASSVA